MYIKTHVNTTKPSIDMFLYPTYIIKYIMKLKTYCGWCREISHFKKDGTGKDACPECGFHNTPKDYEDLYG